MAVSARLFLYFILYSFAGWAIESIFCSFYFRRPVNRGFLMGPLCPIYAAGAFATLCLARLVPHRILPVFLLGLTADTLVEYLTGTLLELIFQTKYWDYSDHRFNLQGRICLTNSLLFGLLSTVLVFWAHPAVSYLIGRIPVPVQEWAALILAVALAADLTVSVATALKLNRRLRFIHETIQTVREKLDRLGFEPSASVRERLEQLYNLRGAEPADTLLRTAGRLAEKARRAMEDIGGLQSRLLRAFPRIRSIRYPEIMEQLIGRLRHRK